MSPDRIEELKCDVCGKRYRVTNPGVAECLRPLCDEHQPKPPRRKPFDLSSAAIHQIQEDRAIQRDIEDEILREKYR